MSSVVARSARAAPLMSSATTVDQSSISPGTNRDVTAATELKARLPVLKKVANTPRPGLQAEALVGVALC